MSEKIPLVQNDDLPWVHVVIRDQDGNLADLTGLTAANVYFREVGTAGTPTTIVCSVLDIPNSKVSFNFAGGKLNVTPGEYEGEVELTIGGLKQTLFEPLTFKVRKQFA